MPFVSNGDYVRTNAGSPMHNQLRTQRWRSVCSQQAVGRISASPFSSTDCETARHRQRRFGRPLQPRLSGRPIRRPANRPEAVTAGKFFVNDTGMCAWPASEANFREVAPKSKQLNHCFQHLVSAHKDRSRFGTTDRDRQCCARAFVSDASGRRTYDGRRDVEDFKWPRRCGKDT